MARENLYCHWESVPQACTTGLPSKGRKIVHSHSCLYASLAAGHRSAPVPHIRNRMTLECSSC